MLGATVAAMFPDRMDTVVLDGVLNLEEYYAERDVELTDTDATFSGFFKGCIVNAENCALAKDATSAEELSQKVCDLLYNLEYNPVVVSSGASTSLVDYGIMKGAIRDTLYNTKL